MLTDTAVGGCARRCDTPRQLRVGVRTTWLKRAGLRPKLSDPFHRTRGFQPQRDGRGRCSARL